MDLEGTTIGLLCAMLDALFGRWPTDCGRFWETVARMPYFSYTNMLTFYEALGWWRQSSGSGRFISSRCRGVSSPVGLCPRAAGVIRAGRSSVCGLHAGMIYFFVRCSSG